MSRAMLVIALLLATGCGSDMIDMKQEILCMREVNMRADYWLNVARVAGTSPTQDISKVIGRWHDEPFIACVPVRPDGTRNAMQFALDKVTEAFTEFYACGGSDPMRGG